MLPEAPLPATRAEIAALIPHQGAMCLLERVKHWSEDSIICTTRSHVATHNPLVQHGRLAIVHLCEYAAQAAAVHGGMSAARAGTSLEPGLLVALRDVTFSASLVPTDGELEVMATRMSAGDRGWVYTFEVRTGAEMLARGRLTIMTMRMQ